MKKRCRISPLLCIMLVSISCAFMPADAKASTPDTLAFTLPQVISMAQELSPSAQSAKHAFLAAQWQYKYYRANYLPSVTLNSSPYLNREINKITLGDGTSAFIRQNQLSTDLSISINQNIAPTGGTLFLRSTLARLDEFEKKGSAYSSQPITIGYSQSLFGYNSLKWDRKIEPLKYREAKKNYDEAMELVAANACQHFFALAVAQSNLEMARINYASADTLYRFAQGRYKIGTITENDMLQLEINRLTEETACMDAEVEVKDQSRKLSTFLGLDGNLDFSLIIPAEVPDLQIPHDKALSRAYDNSPDPDYYKRLKLESESNVAQAKANAGLRADLYMQFGLSQTSNSLGGSYRNPMHQEYVSISLALPILDWGRGKGRVKVAQSQRDLITTNAEQGMNDFQQNITKLVMQFNMQPRKVEVAARTSRLAAHRYEVARRLYIAGRNTILDLNVAQSEKDSAMRAYIASLSTFWTLYYTLRSICGSEITSEI